ncbi:hypothetical protein GCM10019996_04000 [Lentilactobacillus parakefiri]
MSGREQLGEMCSTEQQPVPKPTSGEIKLDFPQSQLRLRLLTARLRTLIETCSEANWGTSQKHVC